MFSNNWFAILALAVVAFLFAVIYWADKKGLNWNLQFVLALGLGIGVGIIFKDNAYFTGNLEYITLIGDIYIGLTQAVVAPLILLTILSSVTALKGTAKLKVLGSRSIFWLLFHTFISILLALGVSIALQIGKNTNPLAAADSATKYANIGTRFTDVIRSFFPQNIFNELANNKVIPIIITALALSVAYISLTDKKKIEPFRSFVEAAKEVVFKVVGYIVDLIPYAILALAADAVRQVDAKWENARNLILVIIVIIALSLFQAFIVSGFLVKYVAKLRPVRFFRKIFDALVMGFSTQSTLTSLPTIINGLTKRVGVKEETANFTSSLGATMGMPGCAGIWPIVLAVFAVNYLGIPYTPLQYITLGIIAFAVSFGTAGVSGTAIITATAVYTTAGLPLEVMVLLLPISFLVGPFRTLANVSCATVSAAIVARQTGTLDDRIFDGEFESEETSVSE